MKTHKVWYSWEDYMQDMRAIDWLKFDHVVGIYRGSLPMAVHISNTRDVPMSIVGFQTRDGTDKNPYWMHNATIKTEDEVQKILVVDDIYDTGYTMNSVIEFIKRNRTRPSAMPKVYGYCLFGKQNAKEIVYSNEHDGSWIVFPWEITDEPV